MSRLIDADALKERFRNNDNSTKDEMLWNHTVRRMIEEQPTAYDVGKVLEEVKKLGTTFCTCNCDNCECPDCEQGTMMKLIIEAVKEGGINGRENDA